MNDLRLAAEIILRTTLLVAAGELASRFCNAQAARRIWAALTIALPLLAGTVLLDLRPPVSMPFVAARGTPVVSVAAQEPWRHVRYVHVDERLRPSLRGIYAAVAGTICVMLLAGAAASRRVIRRARGNGTVRLSEDVASPVTAGVLRPVILLPSNSTEWPDDVRRAAIAHESAHVRQYDTLWTLLAWLGCAGLWFTPAMWYVRRRLRTTAEQASDATAAAIIGSSRRYANLLADVATAAVAQRELALVLPMCEGRSLAARVDLLLAPSRRSMPRLAAVAMTGAILMSLADWRALAHTPLPSEPTARPLLAALASNDAERRADALFHLARWQGREPETMPILAAHLGDSAPIASARRWSYTHEGWGPAHQSWVAPSPGEVAALGLASIGADAGASLLEALVHGDAVSRRNAAWAIGEMRHPRDLPRRATSLLRAALADPDAEVRAAAAWALGDIGDRSAAGSLRRALGRERAPRVRSQLISSLAALDAGMSLEAFRHPD